MKLIETALTIAAIYAGAMWLVLASISLAKKVDYERETFHLGLCFITALGFLGLMLK